MVYFILVIVILSIKDMKDLISQNKKKDLWVYAALMLLVAAFGIYYYSNPESDSFTKIMLSLIGKKG
jgi:multisubunit Na+/H+ antiporter MnhB subunit